MIARRVAFGLLLLGEIIQWGTIVIGGALYPGYDPLRQYISELGATGAVTGPIVSWAGFFPSGVLIVGFCLMAAGLLRRNGLAAASMLLLAWYASGLIGAAVYPCAFECSRSETTSAQALHDLIGGTGYLASVVGVLLGACEGSTGLVRPTMSDVDLDADVKAADPDRWLSSRFVADPVARADLIALYAFEAELMAIPTRVTQPLLAEMRYVWWREQLDGVWAGTARKGHPVLEALTDLVGRRGLDRAPFDALIEAHVGRVHGEPHDLDAFYVGPMQAAVQVLVGSGHGDSVIDAGRMWGLVQVGRGGDAKALRRSANAALRKLPTAGFPAVAHAALGGDHGNDGLKRIRLIWATLTGRV